MHWISHVLEQCCTYRSQSPPAHLLLFRSGMLNSIGLCVCVLFFLFVLLVFCLLVLIFIFVEVFLFLKKNKVGWVGRGKTSKYCMKIILIKIFWKCHVDGILAPWKSVFLLKYIFSDSWVSYHDQPTTSYTYKQKWLVFSLYCEKGS